MRSSSTAVADVMVHDAEVRRALGLVGFLGDPESIDEQLSDNQPSCT